MKYKIILYAVFAMVFQIVLGKILNQGQGSIGVFVFILLVELDPNYSFRYLIKKFIPKK